MEYRVAALKLAGARLAFVSYAAEDSKRAREIERALDAAGIRVWIDQQQLDHRENEVLVGSRIWDALGSSTDFVCIASEAALAKPWVRHELQVASERWLATGAPKIWLVAGPTTPELLDTPYTGLLPWSEDVGAKLVSQLLAHEQPQVRAGALDTAALETLRVQYLMGGSTAVQAINRFDATFPKLKSRIERAAANRFAGRDAEVIPWLRLLAKFLDLRADQVWLCDILARACEIDSPARPILLNNLSTALIYRGALKAALPIIDKVEEIWRAERDWIGVAIALGNRALVALEAGDVDGAYRACGEAEKALGEAANDGALVEPASRLELLVTQGNLYNHLGRACAHQNAWQAAAEAFGDHLAVAVAIEDRRGVAAALGRIAWLDLRRGAPTARTRAALDRYLSLSIAATNPRGVAFARAWRGQLAILEGSLSVAASEFLAEAALRDVLASPIAAFRANAWSALCLDRLGYETQSQDYLARAINAAGEATLDQCDKVLLDALHGSRDSGAENGHPALAELLTVPPKHYSTVDRL